MRIITVSVEVSACAYSEEIELELPDDATDGDADEAAKEFFFNVCEYGWSWKEQKK